MSLLLIAAAALAAHEGPQPLRPRLDWLAGYWLSCDGGRDVSETWSDPRGDLVLGTSITSTPAGAGWEQMRIAPSSRGMLDSVSFYAQPGGQAAAEFPLVRAGATEAVFENPAHDFPQRVIYRREGDRLTGRIEGRRGGAAQAMEWHYRAAPLNTRCPHAAGTAAPAPPDGTAAFERLKGLAGSWRGQRPDGRAIGVSYRLTAGGSVLMETWALGPGRESLTVYHMDGAELVATHYCPQGNQPRLRLTRVEDGRFDFTFRDATGLDPGEAYQHDFRIAIGADGALTRSETYVEGGEAASETITYARVAAR